MSVSVFHHNFREIPGKLWLAACLTAGLAATISVMSGQGFNVKLPESMLDKANQAAQVGQFRQARQLYDILLLRARASGKKEELITALINSSKNDAEFEEFGLAETLAKEALELSNAVYGKHHKRSADAMVALADVGSDNENSIKLYKAAGAIYKREFGDKSPQYAKVLMEISYCLEEEQQTGAAISACRAAMKIYERGQAEDPGYALSLIHYLNLADLEPAERISLLSQALSIQERTLGATHPDLSTTLLQLAAEETVPEKKESLIKRAIGIDEYTFGAQSYQYGRDLASLADLDESLGKKSEARKIRNKVVDIYATLNSSLSTLSVEFLQSYQTLLTELKFDKQAAHVATLLQGRVGQNRSSERSSENTPSDASQHEPKETSSNAEDAASDPEYWQRTELIPIDSVKKFESDYFDHIQALYDKGELKLEAFRQGELVWRNTFGDCPTGIVNMSADHNELKVSWRDGDGPIWHNETYVIGDQKMRLVQSTTSDAYAQQINEQLDEVLSGDADALKSGAVEVVPATYINNNFISEAIRKGEQKALRLYGDGDVSAAADRIASVFDFTTLAINTQRSELNQQLTRHQSWVDAWKHQGLPLIDYITALNDYGYFLQQNGCLKESAEVLSIVTELAPHRAVAFLNLGDSFWKLGQEADAKKSYLTYVHLMKEAREQKSVPSRIIHRITPVVYSIKPNLSTGFVI